MWPAVAVLGALVIGAGVLTGAASYELQIYLVLLLATAVAATYLIPRAVRKEPSVTAGLLTAALIVKLGGSLARYLMLQLVFGGGDALSYHRAGEQGYLLVRSGDLSFIEFPNYGTDFVLDLVPFLYAVTGPSMLGAFLVFSMLSFVGTWLLYRAHRIAFPDGDARIYFLLIFFLPTMAFWPSSLGKDALVVFGLGVSAYGLARLLRGISLGASLTLLFGTAFTFGVRPAVGAMFLAAAALAFMIHPGRAASPLSRPLMLLFVGPLVVTAAVFTIRYALEAERLAGGVNVVVEEYVATRERLLGEGGSTIEGPAPTSPTGFGQAVLTVLFRPFPWELSTPLPALAGLESVLILGIVLLRFRLGVLAIRWRWRGGMVIAALFFLVSVIIPLTAVANFGLLVRQRAQLLPFLFIVLTALPRPALQRRAARLQQRPIPSQAPALSG
jgi:hypothetical protein